MVKPYLTMKNQTEEWNVYNNNSNTYEIYNLHGQLVFQIESFGHA